MWPRPNRRTPATQSHLSILISFAERHFRTANADEAMFRQDDAVTTYVPALAERPRRVGSAEVAANGIIDLIGHAASEAATAR